jgi:hypothetical protein
VPFPRQTNFLQTCIRAQRFASFAPEKALRALATFCTIDLTRVTHTVVQNMNYTYGEDLAFKVLFLNGHRSGTLLCADQEVRLIYLHR